MKIDNEDMATLAHIKEYVQRKPHMVPEINMACSAGIRERLSQMQEKYADIETALWMHVAPRVNKKYRAEILKSKLEKWKDSLCNNWEFYFGKQPPAQERKE